jgi:hypothetical protein
MIRSSHRNNEHFSLHQELLLQMVYYLFPAAKISIPIRRGHKRYCLHQGSGIFFVNLSGKKTIGIIKKQLSSYSFQVTPYEFTAASKKHQFTNCVILNTLRALQPVTIVDTQILCRFSVVHGQINRYECLEMIKFKIFGS